MRRLKASTIWIECMNISITHIIHEKYEDIGFCLTSIQRSVCAEKSYKKNKLYKYLI